MPDLEDVKRIGKTLDGTEIGEGLQFALSILHKGKSKGYAWTWMERVEPKKPKVPNPDVLAISVPNLEIKEMLCSLPLDCFVYDSHYDGFPAILIRLSKIDLETLEEWITEAWKTKRSKLKIS